MIAERLSAKWSGGATASKSSVIEEARRMVRDRMTSRVDDRLAEFLNLSEAVISGETDPAVEEEADASERDSETSQGGNSITF